MPVIHLLQSFFTSTFKEFLSLSPQACISTCNNCAVIVEGWGWFDKGKTELAKMIHRFPAMHIVVFGKNLGTLKEKLYFAYYMFGQGVVYVM